MWSLDYRTHAQCQGSVPSEELSIRSIDAFLSMSYDCPAHGWCCLPATPYVLNLILIYIYIKGVSNYLTWKYTQISVTFRRLRLHQDAYIHNINLILRTWPPLFSSPQHMSRLPSMLPHSHSHPHSATSIALLCCHPVLSSVREAGKDTPASLARPASSLAPPLTTTFLL